MGKTTRPFRYDLNQIPYDYTVKATNRLKGLDLVDRVPEELWMEICNLVQKAVNKAIPKKKKCKKAKWLLEETLQITEERDVKSSREREKYIQLNAEFQRIAKRDKKAFFNEECKETNRIGKTRYLQDNCRHQRSISCKDGHDKGQKQ